MSTRKTLARHEGHEDGILTFTLPEVRFAIAQRIVADQ